MGTKIMCRQGGCGICIVEAKMQLSASHPNVSASLNSVISFPHCQSVKMEPRENRPHICRKTTFVISPFQA